MLVGTYLLYATIMVLAHPRLIYPFGPDPFDAPEFRQEIVSERDVALAIYEGESAEAVLFFMGNGGALAYFTYTLNAHVAADRHLYAVEYPGGGGIPGTPSEARLKADALAAYDWIAARHEGPIVVHGYSMGTGLAQYVAAERDVAAIILDAPFVKMCALMTQASWLPACWLPFVQKWNSAALAPAISAPVLIQHGQDDQMIPPSVGRSLADLMEEADISVTFHAVPNANHNNLAGVPGYRDRIDAFLSKALK
ncbi:alpha/beta hydrolase [Cognatiyoonia sp. IB215182]|uniref:alpha/beta hydrolase n=1 Tax=Cognatiyoonia sp. IB215182 TaxID=3097353 RepID=UPI002A11C5EF|nr:prolyl oligopeptidase family serine peptidase [Cognatiyoonia sp. IB215182]MDX8353368.1 prolyl oligopeptidase family serine peptidase [Cognatiyoonia sp. IB215182]